MNLDLIIRVHASRDEGVVQRRWLGNSGDAELRGAARLAHVFERVAACVEIKILRHVSAESSRRPPRHRRDACSMHPTHWLISTQVAATRSVGTGWFYQVAGACIFLLALFILFVVPCVIPDYYRLGLTFLCDSRSEREGFLTGPARDTELTDCRNRAEPCWNQPPRG